MKNTYLREKIVWGGVFFVYSEKKQGTGSALDLGTGGYMKKAEEGTGR